MPPDYSPNEQSADGDEGEGHELEAEAAVTESSVIIMRGRDAGAARRRVLYLPPAYGDQLSVSDGR